MIILLDENMPRKLIEALRNEGHRVESVLSLRLAGVDNGRLYRLALTTYDLLFTKDAGFAEWTRHSRLQRRVKVVRVVIPQQPQDDFVRAFMSEFRRTDWLTFTHGDSWPKS